MTLPAVLISVADSGIGIAPADQARIFTRFWRSEEAQRRQIQGSGLGLAIVKEFVEGHSGRVWLESAPGEGTTFYFSVPRAQG
jgi:signal transduction histidine kinase